MPYRDAYIQRLEDLVKLFQYAEGELIFINLYMWAKTIVNLHRGRIRLITLSPSNRYHPPTQRNKSRVELD